MSPTGVRTMSNQFTHVRALSLSDAIVHLAAGGARLMAGGTDLPASLQIDAARTTVGRAADAALAEAIPLADNRYKIPLFRALLVDTLEDVCGLTRA